MEDTALNLNANDAELAALDAKINALLPPRYVGCFEEIAPTSMGSASLRYDADGRVKWGEIWTTFCHLALAGGPPHRGRLLGAVTAEEVESSTPAYEAVVAELRRAIGLCVELPLSLAQQPGWIGLECPDEPTAAWLVRAIVAENVIARREGVVLYVPAGPAFRIEKEIKNVVVCVAKTCHYLFDHLEPEQQPTGEARSLIGPPLPHEMAAAYNLYEKQAATLQQTIEQATGLTTRRGEAPGWVGVEFATEDDATWMLRAVAVEDVLVRREETVLYVPVDIRPDVDGAIAKTADAVATADRLRRLRARRS